MEPKAYVFRSRSLWTDLIARILNVGIDALQMRERFSQRRHIWQVKRHVINRFRRRFAFEQRNRHAVVSNRDAAFEVELFPQPQRALEPLRAFFRIAHGQTKVANLSEGEWNFHVGTGSLDLKINRCRLVRSRFEK